MEFLSIAFAHFLALLSPGPDFFLILQASLKLPRKYGLSLVAGIGMANGVYLLMSVIGLEGIRNCSILLTIMKYLGGTYLIFIGFFLLRAPRNKEGGETSVIFKRSLWGQFLVGFMSGILNPKNILFYLALFALIVSEETTFGVRVLYACWMFCAVLIWDSVLLYSLSWSRVKIFLNTRIYLVEKISGLVLASFGIYLALN